MASHPCTPSNTNSSRSCDSNFASPETSLFVVVLSIVLIATTILGNFLVLLAVKIKKNLRKRGKCFVASLALADLLVGLLVFPMRLYQEVHPQRYFHVNTCIAYRWLGSSCVISSITTLSVIGIDRFYKISSPFGYRARVTTRRCAVTSCAIWFYSTILALSGVLSYSEEATITVSKYRRCTRGNDTYYLIAFFVSFVFPTAILVVTYSLIFHKAYRRRRELSLLTESAKLGAVRMFSKDLRNAKTLAVVVLTFLICWGPAFLTLILRNHFAVTAIILKTPLAFKIIQFVLPFGNSCCNPVIYALYDKQYRIAFKTIFRKICAGFRNLS